MCEIRHSLDLYNHFNQLTYSVWAPHIAFLDLFLTYSVWDPHIAFLDLFLFIIYCVLLH